MPTFDIALPDGPPSGPLTAPPVVVPPQEIPNVVKNRMLVMTGKPSVLVP